jgi:ribonuclease J
MAALSRMANRDHMIRIGQGRHRPARELTDPRQRSAICRVINSLTRWAQRRPQGQRQVHVSGHASAGELVCYHNIVRPSNVMPVHGEWRHLKANGDLAMEQVCHRKTWCWLRTVSSSTSSTGRQL